MTGTPKRARRAVARCAISFGEPLGYGETAPNTKCFRGDFQPGRSLLALIFVAIHLIYNIAHQGYGQMKRIGDLLGRLVAFDIEAQDLIEHFVFWERIGILLVGPQLGGWRLDEYVLRDGVRMALVRDAGERIDERFRHVADHCEAAAHVAVERAIADGQFALISGSEHQGAPL